MATDREQIDRSRFETRSAMYLSALTAALTAVTFGAALVAVPISGANCPGDCIDYPYLDTTDRYPRDYVWMYFAGALMVVYLFFVVALRAAARPDRQLLGQMAVAVAVASTAVLAPTYFVQASVVPASLAAGQTDGVPLLTQYNPHGVFIALEEIGYLLMVTSFALLAPMISGTGRTIGAVRVLFIAAFAVTVLALGAYSLAYGIDRQDRFEVVAITVAWLVLIINGILLTLTFRHRLAHFDTSH